MAKKKIEDREKTPAALSGGSSISNKPKLKNKIYEKELYKLQVELVKLQDWTKHKGLRVIVIFEGRDAAGKGGVIRRIVERVSPRVFRIAALPAPTEREKSQMYIQRYMQYFPAGGEIVLFDRSWYNRAGVERVMEFCSEDEYRNSMHYLPMFERAIVDSGVILIKYWFEVSLEEQTRRFENRITDPRKRWKLSPMDLESHRRWYDYSRAKDILFTVTDTDYAPWYVVPSDDKKRARLNCISHMLSVIPYEELPFKAPKLPKRQKSGGYAPPKYAYNYVPRKF